MLNHFGVLLTNIRRKYVNRIQIVQIVRNAEFLILASNRVKEVLTGNRFGNDARARHN
jgi:hypothetical protein